MIQSGAISVVIPRRGINDEGKGKKHALFRLISQANTEWVWLRDDDVLPPSAMPAEDQLAQYDLIILPLRMSLGNHTFLEQLQVAEYAAIQQLTVVSALRHHPILCSSANMLVRRERWLESYQDLHVDIVSGDDMFLLESFKRRQLRIGVMDTPELTATIEPVPYLRDLLHQRMRWAGKAPHYTDRDIRFYGGLVLVANILQLICPPVLLIKFPIEYELIKKRDPEVSFFTALVLELIYPLYMLCCIVGGLFRRTW